MVDVITVHRHIMSEQQGHPNATGELSQVLSTIALATKIISRNVNKAGLLNVLGSTGRVNVQGERVAKLDEFSNRIVQESLHYSGAVAGMASEEDEHIIPVRSDLPQGNYLVTFDPLDGSSNIDANVTIGTIFGIYRKDSDGSDVTEADFLQPGHKLAASGYAVYGSSTMLVYTTGRGVHGFTLDPEYGEYLLSHPDIRLPDTCRCYSANESNSARWSAGTRAFIDTIKSKKRPRYQSTTSRYIGSLVGDFHRNLLYGGVFLYPEDSKNPNGKLRLLYECFPLALIAEAAGGAATTGTQRILDITPTEVHQRVPFCVGNREEVRLYEEMVRAHS